MLRIETLKFIQLLSPHDKSSSGGIAVNNYWQLTSDSDPIRKLKARGIDRLTPEVRDMKIEKAFPVVKVVMKPGRL